MATIAAGSDTADRLRGIGLYCIALLLFACLDTSAKYAEQFVPTIEVAWLRFVSHTIFAALFLRPWLDLSPYATGRPAVQVLRSILLFSSTLFNFFALTRLQLAETTTINFSSAFVVAGFAGPVLGEWIGPRRWAAITVGFLGVFVVARPGSHAFQPAVLFSIAAMLCNSGYVLLTRLLAATESAAGMLLYPAILASVLLAPAALPVFVIPPTAVVAFLLGFTGLCGAAGHWFLIHAHRIAPAPVLAPFVYGQLLWMVILGYLVFGDVPGLATLLGALIIIGSGLYILYRERVHGDR